MKFTKQMQRAQNDVLGCLVELSTEETMAVLGAALDNHQQAQDHQHDWEWEEEKPLNDE